MAVIKEMRRILHSINGMAQAKEVRSHELMASFLEFIDAYATIKELSMFEYFENENDGQIPFSDFFRVMKNFSDIFQPIFMSLFTWSLLAISAVLLILQVEIVECTLIFCNKNLPDFSFTENV